MKHYQLKIAKELADIAAIVEKLGFEVSGMETELVDCGEALSLLMTTEDVDFFKVNLKLVKAFKRKEVD